LKIQPYQKGQRWADEKQKVEWRQPLLEALAGNVISMGMDMMPCCFDKDTTHQFGELASTII